MSACYLTGPDGTRLDLKPNEPLTIGRGVCGIQDKRLSRQQLELVFRGADIECKTLGVNPSMITKQASGMTVALRKGESCYLRDGDNISLLPNESFNFKVSLEEPKPEPMEASAPPAENPAKRRLQPVSDDDGDDIIEAHAGKKARQEEAPKAARPACKYGAGCYQKNPDHKRKFAHPGDRDFDATPPTHVQASRAKASDASPPSSPHTHASAPAPKPQHHSQPQSQPAASSSQPVKPQLPVRVVHSDAHSSLPSGSPATKGAAPRLLAVQDSDNAEDDPSLKKLKTLDEARKAVSVQAQKQTDKPAPPPPKKPAVEDPTPGAYSLAFPALGTSKDFGFPAEKAAPIVMGVVKEFLKKNAKLPRLQLVLVESDAAVLAVYKKHAASVDDKRFQVRGGDITSLASKEAVPCRYVANCTTWRFKSTAHPASKAVADAAAGLLEDAKRRYNFAKVGKAYPVAVQTQAPLHKREGVHYVVCVAPPVCIKGKPDAVDEEQAAELIKQTHTELFEEFLKLTR